MKNGGAKSLKFTTTAGDIANRYDFYISKALGVIASTKATVTFYAKSNAEVQFQLCYDGFSFLSEETESKPIMNNDKIVTIEGNNQWKKYSVKIYGSPFQNHKWDFSKPMSLNLSVTKQTLASDLELYLDDVEYVK